MENASIYVCLGFEIQTVATQWEQNPFIYIFFLLLKRHFWKYASLNIQVKRSAFEHLSKIRRFCCPKIVLQMLRSLLLTIHLIIIYKFWGPFFFTKIYYIFQIYSKLFLSFRFIKLIFKKIQHCLSEI